MAIEKITHIRFWYSLGFLWLGALFFSCGSPPIEPLVWEEENGLRSAALDVREGPIGFERITGQRTGVTFVNQLSDDQLAQNKNLLNGSGVALGDVDGDGLTDLYFCRLNGPNVLYKNLGNWQFEDITDAAGVAAPNRFSTGATFADLDGDTDLDLIVVALGGPNTIFFNDGTGQFTAASEAGIASGKGSTSLALADADGDGDLDLYIANYKRRTLRDSIPPFVLAFDQIVEQRTPEGFRPLAALPRERTTAPANPDDYRITPAFAEHYELDVRGTLIFRLELGEANGFYRNDGTGRFAPISFTDGTFLDENGAPLTAAPKDWSLAVRFQDMNADGFPDLYVCNDFESPDRIWLNDGTGRFRAMPALALRSTSNSTMSVDFSDVDRDGALDFFLVDMLSRDHRRRLLQLEANAPKPEPIGAIANRPQAARNMLLRNRGDGTYADVAHYADVAASEWSWSGLFMDVDLDGYEDVLIANGHLYDVQNFDAKERERTVQIRNFAQFQRLILQYPHLMLPNMAFRNRGDLTFEEVSENWGLGQEADVAHGMAFADLDNDGDLDVVMNRLRAEAALYRNTGGASRIAVRLKGQAPNTQAIGAKIELLGGPVPQVKEVIAAGAYVSASDPLYVFATGTSPDLRLRITWRTGTQTMHTGLQPNRIYEISEPAEATPPARETEPASPAPFFRDISAEIGHQHAETVVDDFKVQPLLPRKISQSGPSIAWFDWDADGDDDLLIGGGAGGRMAVYRNSNGRFSRQALSATLPADQVGIAVFRNNGNPAVFSGFVRYENNDRAEAVQTISGVNAAQDLPNAPPSVGAVAAADVDGDGDLDVFAGGHVAPNRYPAAVPAQLWRAEGQTFQPDTEQTALWGQLGVVSAAVFSDFDQDGDPDLWIAVHGGPIRLLENENGRFTDATDRMGLSAFTGWWNGLVPADLNNDGRLELIATNWGLNTRYRATPERPYRIYYDDFDGNGTIDVIESYQDEAGRWVPHRNLMVFSQAVPFVRRRVNTHNTFATSDLPTIFGTRFNQAPFVEVNTLAHTVFAFDGTAFSATPLPAEAQWAPAFGINVGDFDGDGAEDVFLAQNFFATELQTARADAGRGLWLRGDGSGELTPVAGSESGVLVYGEQRGSALGDFNNDGRVDLAVTQNGAQTKVYQNVGANIGWRIRLRGPSENPAVIGAQIRLKYTDGTFGPVREIHAGSGYASQDSTVPVLGQAQSASAIWVRWPDGTETETAVSGQPREVEIARE